MDSTFDGKALARMGEFLRELYVLRDVDGLYATICRGLADFVPGENVFVGEHDMERTLVTGCVVRHVFETPDFITVVNQCAGQHPLWEPIRTGGQAVRVLSEHASARRWENTRLYKEALGLEGVRDHISVEFGNRTARLTSIGIFRDRRGFGRRDENVMAFLIPHFEQALANARMVEAVGLTDAGPVSEQSRHILLDETGRPLEIPKAVEGCWRAFFPKEGRASVETPEAVRDWLVFARGLFDRGVLPTAVRPLVVSGPNSCLELRLTRRHFAPGYVLLMSVRPQGGGRVPRLTPREREVLHWVREGKTNEEIALILACKVTSVKTHLKHIFRKLGVDNRTAAARMSGL